MKTSRVLELDIAGHWSVSTIVQENIAQVQCQLVILNNDLETDSVCHNSKSVYE